MPHDHHHHGTCETCDHSGDADEANALAFSLYQKIDLQNLECLNESVDGSGATVFKPWNDRFDVEKYVESDCDAELIFNIPFTGDVKLTGMAIFGSPELSKIRLFKSKMRLSFNDINTEPDQEFVLGNSEGLLEFPVKPTKFSNVHHLTLHLVNKDRTDDDKPCKIFFLAFRGVFTEAKRDAIVITNYELRPTENVANELMKNSRTIQ